MIILGINAYHGDAAAAIIEDGKLIAAVEEERFNRVKHCAGFPTESVRYCLEAAGVSIEEVEHVGISRDPSAHLHKKVLFAATRAARQAIGRGRQEADGRRQAAGGRRQTAVGRGQLAVGGGQNIEDAELSTQYSALSTPPAPPPSGDGNGRGPGIFGQIKDRLGNAAKVRDLKGDLARALGVPKSTLRAQFHNIEHHRAHLASSFFVSPFERAALLSIDGYLDDVGNWRRELDRGFGPG